MCVVITTRLAEEEPGSRENRIDRWSTAPAQRGLRTLLTLRWRVGKELTLARGLALHLTKHKPQPPVARGLL